MLKKVRIIALALLVVFTSSVAVIATPAPAHADRPCKNGGYYVLGVRGSGEHFNDARARSVKESLIISGALVQAEWAELGNTDGSVTVTDTGEPHVYPDSSSEYPATPVNDYHALPPLYGASVEKGMLELVAHLNHRYLAGPVGQGCLKETLVLWGYSQGADVIGWALRRHDLSQAAKDHIGFVALYGDPKFNSGSLSDRMNNANFWSNWWWVRGDSPGYRYVRINANSLSPTSYNGILSPRDPYVPEWLNGRFGSWCASGDIVCAFGTGFNWDAHTNAYQNHWIADSVSEIVYEAKRKRNELNPATPVSVAPFSVTQPASTAPTYDGDPSTPTPIPSIHTLLRTTDSGGTNQVYAATKSAVTEAWWVSGGNGVHTSEIIHISQNNIVGMDKTNLPEGKQAVYTAVPDGVWETWWDAQHSPGSAKIINGLSGVRQVIANNRVESGQYVHRLYILAEDGPYEAWWKDGDPEGIHISRLVNIANPVSMVKTTGPLGEDQLYVASAGWVYEIKWGVGVSGVQYRTMIDISQGDIDSLSKLTLTSGHQRLFTGTSTGVWQSIWNNNGSPTHNPEVLGQTGVVHSEAMKPGSAYQIYIATGGVVKEYWYTTSSAGNSTLLTRSQGDITTFDKFNGPSHQQVYTGTSSGQVYETYWGGGTSPTTNLLFTVSR